MSLPVLAFWDRISEKDRSTVNEILLGLEAEGKSINGLASFSELADRLNFSRFTVQRHLQELPECWEQLRVRKISSPEEALSIGVSDGWRQRYLYDARETLAAFLLQLERQRQAIEKMQAGKNTIVPPWHTNPSRKPIKNAK